MSHGTRPCPPGVEQFLNQFPGYLRHSLVGSKLLTKPVESPKDIDVAVLIDYTTCPDPRAWGMALDKSATSADYDTDTTWHAVRIGDWNFLVTTNVGWFERMLAANEVIRALNLTDKGDRIVINRIVRDELPAEAAEACRSNGGVA